MGISIKDDSVIEKNLGRRLGCEGIPLIEIQRQRLLERLRVAIQRLESLDLDKNDDRYRFYQIQSEFLISGLIACDPS